MAVSTFAYPGNYNGFIPSFEASGQLISFTRDPKTFKINEYAQYVESKKPIGIYAVLDADQPARVVTDDDFAWPDGAEAPAGNDNLLPFQFLDYRCIRKVYPFTLGDEAVDNSDWKVLAAHADMASQQCMTGRTLLTQKLVQNAANWGSNTGPVQTLVNGIAGWYSASNDENSPNFLAIKKSLLAAYKQIKLYTNGIVRPDDLRLVLSPGDAQAIGETAEIHDYVAHSPVAKAQVRGEVEGDNVEYGLPNKVYGFRIVVEDATRVSSRPSPPQSAQAVGTRSFIWQDGQPALLSRPGGLEGKYGSPSFSTLQLYFYREMEVQSLDDRVNERTLGRVVESRAPVLAAIAAGYLFQNVNR